MIQKASRGRSGKALHLFMAAVMLISLSVFAVGSPSASSAAIISPVMVTRSVDRPSFTIGEIMTYTNTYTVAAGEYLEAATLYDEFSNRGVRVVASSSVLQDISGSPTLSASFRDSSEPYRQPFTNGMLYPFSNGFSFEWELTDIDNSESPEPYVFTLTYQVHYRGTLLNDNPLQFPADGGQMLRSAAGLDWTDEFVGSMTSMPSNRVAVYIYQPVLQLTKWVGPPDMDYAGGQDIEYVIDITNSGWSTAYDITVDDVLPTGFDWENASYTVKWWPSGIVEDGVSTTYDEGSSTVTFDFGNTTLYPWGEILEIVIFGEVPEGANAYDLLTNTADVDWSSMYGEVDGERVYDDADWEGALWTADTDEATLMVADGPHVKVTSTYVDAQPPFKIGDPVVIDVTLKNTGSLPATPVGLMEIFDDQRLAFVSASIAPDETLPAPTEVNTTGVVIAPAPSGTTLVWDTINGDAGLLPGESWTVRLTFEAIGTGYAFTTGQSMTPWVAPPGPNSTVEPQYTPVDTDTLMPQIFDPADIVFTKASDPATDTVLLPGDVITYGIVAENNTGMDLEDPACIEELPDSVDYVPGSMVVYVNGWDVALTDADDGDGGTYDAATHTITFLGTGLYVFDAGDEVIMTFDVEVADLERSYYGVLNQADLLFNDQLAMVSNEVYHFVDPIEITKSGIDLNGGRLVPGDEIEWTITIENVGLSQTTNVVISDSVPANTTYVVGSITGTGADDTLAPDLTWDIGVLPVAGTATVTFRTTVDEDVPAGTVISNQASVSSDNSPVTLSDDATTDATGDATLLRTGGDEIMLLIVGLFVLVAGGALVVKGRKMMQAGTEGMAE